MPPQKVITRFAPSPTGYLHLGHAYSAKLSHDFAQEHDGKFLLRIEDIDHTRCSSEYETALYEDLRWIGLDWERPVRRQSDHMQDYREAQAILQKYQLLYPCFCSRKDIQREIKASSSAPHDQSKEAVEGPIYPGTCRRLPLKERQTKMANGTPYALRLDMAKALELVGNIPLFWTDREAGEQVASAELLKNIWGDVILARKETPTSYHLSVVVDDHLQKISHIIRGKDLFTATHLHRLLQFLLGYVTPLYDHHNLLTDENGRRYAKRDNSKTLRFMRENGEKINL